MHITPAEYTKALRRLDAMRTEALARQDRSALAAIALRKSDLERVFHGYDPASATERTGRRPAA